MRAADVQVRCKYVDKCIHGRKCINCWREGNWNYVYHVYDLLQGEAELQPHGLGLVEHRPLQAVVELRWKVSMGFTIFGEGPHYFVLISHQRISEDTVLSWHLNKAAAAGTLLRTKSVFKYCENYCEISLSSLPATSHWAVAAHSTRHQPLKCTFYSRGDRKNILLLLIWSEQPASTFIK